jgi:hypothetical protein
MIALYLVLLLSWTLVCVLAGKVWEQKRLERADLNARDEWANRVEQRMKP